MNDGLSNPSQLLLRGGPIAAESLLLINPPADGIYARLPDATALTLDWGAYRSLKNQGRDARFGLEPPADAAPDGYARVVMFLTKAKARTRLLLDYATTVGAAGGRVWLLGEKKSGIASAARLLAEAAGASEKLDAARHCMLFEARVPSPRPGPFDLDRYWDLDRWSVGERSYPVASLPGVFSHGELDPGTRLLLDHIALEPGAEVLDFGCGCGIVGALAAGLGARVTAVDSDALALAATTRTLALNRIEAATVAAADRLAAVAGRFDLIVSNPPFHHGTRTATATAHGLIRDAPAHLRRHGRLLLVANAFLDYPRVLDATFGSHRVLAQNNRYRVYEARARAP